ncbi:MAG TPA: hypothetical protein GXX14_10420 [Clostridiaceae bacterium]|nr:hypothetical protein [Clostridiaceae bacterium]
MYISDAAGLAGNRANCGNSELLFFILVYLLLFYDSSCIGILAKKRYINSLLLQGGSLEDLNSLFKREKNDTALFFILVFLLLFY